MSVVKDVILTIDEGTSGTRSAVIGKDGNVHSLYYLPLRVDSPKHGVVEQDANEILTATLSVCKQTILDAKQKGFNIIGLSIATQRSTAILWDKKTGKAIVPAMVWQDSRFSDQLMKMASTWDQELIDKTGRPVGIRSPYLWASFHLENTDIVKQTYTEGNLLFGTVDSFLLWHFSEDKKWLSTPTNATSCGAYCLKTHDYHYEWLKELNFPKSLLPKLCNDNDDFGNTDKNILGISIPILSCLGDLFAGAIGLGCINKGQSMCIHGTGSFIDLIVGDLVPVLNNACESTLVMTSRRNKDVSNYSVETFVPTTGSALNWVCEKLDWFDSPEQISEFAAKVSSSDGVSFIPALTGIRVPYLEPHAKASLNGISISSTKENIAYAILEGISNSVADCIRANEQATGLKIKELIVGGGMSNSDVLLQTQADLSGVPVLKMAETSNASLRGAAFMAGSGGLLWNSLEEACLNLKVTKKFIPKISSELRNIKISLWEARVAMEMQTAANLIAKNQE